MTRFLASGAFWKTIDSQKIIDTVLYGFPTKEFTQVGETDKYNFYFIVPDYSEYVDFLREKLGDELYGEFDALLQNAGPLKEQLSVKEPVRPVTAAGIGEQFTFETTDLDGNAVTSAALFAGHLLCGQQRPCPYYAGKGRGLRKIQREDRGGVRGGVKDCRRVIRHSAIKNQVPDTIKFVKKCL